MVQDAQAAFGKLQEHISAFLVLDLNLVDAVHLLKKVVATFYEPLPYIIAVDSFSCSMAQADMLNLGVDVCIEKPLDVQEVIAVINAALRRADRLARPKPFRAVQPIDRGTLHIDQSRRNVTIGDRDVSLTVKEYDILCLLASYPGTVLSKAQIYEQVWGEDYEYASTSVSDLISSLRKKLGLNPRDGRFIQTVHGFGYRFVNSE